MVPHGGTKVKRSQSATRVLAVLEGVARSQPVGVSALARLIGEDKSTVQRALLTLADAGWIRPASGPSTQWELTAHIYSVAHTARGSDDLRQRVGGALRALRDQSEETVLLTVPDGRQLVLMDVFESRQTLRFAPHIGMSIPVRESAAGRALLPYMTPERQVELLGLPPDGELAAALAATCDRGYSISDNHLTPELLSFGAAILDVEDKPLGAVVVSAWTGRTSADRGAQLGEMVARTAGQLSYRLPL
jgi:IclR family acetate operon transcriptional repressor